MRSFTILLIICCTSQCDSQVTLELCQAPIKDQHCVLKCLTPDLSQSVVFKKDNTEYASCKFILGTLSCTSIYPTRALISQQSSPTAFTSLNITQLSRAGDQGSWTCDYGSTGSTAHDLTVLDSQVTLELCQAPIKDQHCVLKCLTPDLSQSVVFKKDNTEYASCKFILGTLSCTSIYPTRALISQQSSPTAFTSLNITQLSRAGDQGSWTCDYGSTGSTAHDLTVLDSQVTLELCQAPTKDQHCVLKCLTPDLSQSVVFKKDNTEYASCKFILGSLICTSIYPTRSLISQQSSPAITFLNITQLSRVGDQGSWTCDYGSTGSTAHDLTVLDSQVTLELCQVPTKDQHCVLKCLTPDLSQSVVFKKDNTEYASCKFILGTLSCTSIYPTRALISQQSSPTAFTSLNITQLSRAGDQGSWTCDYGSTGSIAHDLTVLDSQVTLELCQAPTKDQHCVLKCLTPDLSQSVVFKKDNTEYASCKFILGSLICTSIYPTRSLISQQSSPAITFLNITQLSRVGDQGSWTCDYGSTGSTAHDLTVLDSQVTLELCQVPTKDQHCVLKCLTPDLSQSVVFKKDNTEYASCKFILGTLSCTSIYPTRALISQQSSPTAFTSLNITQLSRAGDQGSWTCDYGSTGSIAHDLTVLDSQVTLELCQAPTKDQHCVLKCLTPDLSQSVVFKKDNTEYASCKFILGSLICTSIYPTRSLISQQSSPAITFLNITQLSRVGDQGSWTCDYGSTGSTAHDLTVLDSQVTLELCQVPTKDQHCVLKCLTPDLSQSVVFKKDNTEYASCKFILGTLSCTSIYPTRALISQQSSPTAFTSLNITQLSRAGDQGSWTCDYGSTGSIAHDLTVLDSQVTLELCQAPTKDQHCVLKCLTPDLSQSVVFKKDNTEYASCKFILGTLSCTSIYPTRALISQQSSPIAFTSLNITQLSRAGDQGSWTCDYGSTGSTAHDLTVLAEPTEISTSVGGDIDYCTGDQSATYQVTLGVTCSSAVNISAELFSQTTGKTYTERQTVIKGHACADVAEHMYTAVFTITSTTGGLTGDGYILTFKTQLSAGVGEVYETVFPGDISFPCPAPSSTTTLKSNDNILLNIIILLSIIIITA